MSRERGGLLLVLGGSALALALQVAAPVGVPLYDGVVVMEPYRYLQPTGDQAGNPTSYREEEPISEGVSPVVTAATAEQPPQAQLIAQRAAFELTPGATSIVAEISPVQPPGPPPTSGPILGNAYRFTVTDQSGTQLRISPCDGCASLVLRAPEGGPAATIMRFGAGGWSPVVTRHAGTVALYQTSPEATGIFAVVATGETSGGLDLALVLATAGIALIVVAFAALLYLRARPVELPVAQLRRPGSAPPGGRVPSKRKRSKRPPSGRSGP